MYYVSFTALLYIIAFILLGFTHVNAYAPYVFWIPNSPPPVQVELIFRISQSSSRVRCSESEPAAVFGYNPNISS